jgi:hypothetical protein
MKNQHQKKKKPNQPRLGELVIIREEADSSKWAQLAVTVRTGLLFRCSFLFLTLDVELVCS